MIYTTIDSMFYGYLFIHNLEGEYHSLQKLSPQVMRDIIRKKWKTFITKQGKDFSYSVTNNIINSVVRILSLTDSTE